VTQQDAANTWLMLCQMGYRKVSMFPLDDEDSNSWQVEAEEPGVTGARFTYTLTEVKQKWESRQ